MLIKRNSLIAIIFLLLTASFAALPASAKGDPYKNVVKHLRTRYQAKKVNIPLVWLARFAVRVVRPAGVKSFSVTMFENLQFSRRTLDQEMQAALDNSLTPDWSSILRVRSRHGAQVYLYMREAGENVKIMLVTIDNNQAAIIRAKLDPDKIAEFIDNPKIFGISLSDNDRPEIDKAAPPENSIYKEDPK